VDGGRDLAQYRSIALMPRLLVIRLLSCIALTLMGGGPALAQGAVEVPLQPITPDFGVAQAEESAVVPPTAASEESRPVLRRRLTAERYDVTPRQLRRGRALAATSVALLYSGLFVHHYFAWWHDQTFTPFETEWDGFFGINTYSGGADKLGHLYMNLALSRATTGILRFGRFDPLSASIAGATLSWLSYLLLELRDGLSAFQFSWGDLLANSLGTAVGLLLTHVPQVDRFVSFRMMYWPSTEFRQNPSLNFNEDYSGQTFLVALHPAGFGDRVGFFRYIDLVVGFNADHYLPNPRRDDRPERQRLYVGFALNLQEVLNRGPFNRPRERDTRAQEAARGVFADWAAEHIQVPYTAVPLIPMQRTRQPD
jgi:hypothetical protein